MHQERRVLTGKELAAIEAEGRDFELMEDGLIKYLPLIPSNEWAIDVADAIYGKKLRGTLVKVGSRLYDIKNREDFFPKNDIQVTRIIENPSNFWWPAEKEGLLKK